MEQRNVELALRVRQLLKDDQPQGITQLLHELHPTDLVEILEELSLEENSAVLTLFDDGFIAAVFEEMDPRQVASVLPQLEDTRVSSILEEMAMDDLVDLLGDLPATEADQLLSKLETEDVDQLRELLQYEEDTAGGIMTREFIALSPRLTVGQATEHVRRLAEESEAAYYIYVVNEQRSLVGVLSLRELIISPVHALLEAIMETNVISVAPDTDQEEVARVVARYDLLAIPVVNGNNRMLGIVTVDDVIDVIEEEATEDIYRMAGTGADETEEMAAGTWRKVRRRLPWLSFLLVGNFLSANVIQGFTTTLENIVALAYFIPVLIDMGGNVGTQSFAVVVRGISTGELDTRRLFRTVMREAQVGVVMGLLFGMAMALIAMSWQNSPVLGVVVGLSMSLTLFTASIIGTFVPLAFDRLGVDIAVASGPFITTAIDVTGLIIYFYLATILMRHLVVPG